MRPTIGALLLGTTLLLAPPTGRAQVSTMAVGGPATSYRVQGIYTAAPGLYGTTYGVASYGVRQTYTTFTSPYGAGYGYGYAPASFLPGPYGAYLWSPSSRSSRAVWRTPYYGTYALPTAPAGVAPPPIGVYAPSYGPGIPPTLYGW